MLEVWYSEKHPEEAPGHVSPLSVVVPEGMPESAFQVVPLLRYSPMDADDVVPVAQQLAAAVAQAIAVKEVGVVPLLLVYAVHVPLESCRISGVVVVWQDQGQVPEVVWLTPIAAQKEVLSQAIWVRLVTVTPDCSVQDVHVVPGDDDPLLEKMVAPEEVVPITKHTGWAELLGHTIWESAVVLGMVSFVQVTVDPEMVAVSSTPLDEVPAPMAMQAGVVALFGHTMSVSWETPDGRELLVHVVPFVETAAAPAEEPYPTAMQAPVVQPTPSILVSDDGNVADDHPELVSAIPAASGAVFGAAELVGTWPVARQINGPTFGHSIPSATTVVFG